MIGWIMYDMGVEEERPPALPDGLTLAEMLEANDLIIADRKQKMEDQKTHGNPVSFGMSIDPRGIAAIYVAAHFPADHDNTIATYGDKVVMVLSDKHLDVKPDPARIVEAVALGGKLSEDPTFDASLRALVLEAVVNGEGSLDLAYQVEVRNEYGVALLQPWEYSVLSDENMETYIDSLKDQTAWRMYQFSNEQVKKSAANDAFKDRVHYMRTRGIPYGVAIRMLFGQISHHNVFYLKPHDELIRMFHRDANKYIAGRKQFEKKHNIKSS